MQIEKKIIIMDALPLALRERGGRRIVPLSPTPPRDEEGSRPRAVVQHLCREIGGVGPSPGGPVCPPVCPFRLHGLERGADAERKGRAGGICSPLPAPQHPSPRNTWGVSRAGDGEKINTQSP